MSTEELYNIDELKQCLSPVESVSESFFKSPKCIEVANVMFKYVCWFSFLTEDEIKKPSFKISEGKKYSHYRDGFGFLNAHKIIEMVCEPENFCYRNILKSEKNKIIKEEQKQTKGKGRKKTSTKEDHNSVRSIFSRIASFVAFKTQIVDHTRQLIEQELNEYKNKIANACRLLETERLKVQEKKEKFDSNQIRIHELEALISKLKTEISQNEDIKDNIQSIVVKLDQQKIRVEKQIEINRKKINMKSRQTSEMNNFLSKDPCQIRYELNKLKEMLRECEKQTSSLQEDLCDILDKKNVCESLYQRVYNLDAKFFEVQKIPKLEKESKLKEMELKKTENELKELKITMNEYIEKRKEVNDAKARTDLEGSKTCAQLLELERIHKDKHNEHNAKMNKYYSQIDEIHKGVENIYTSFMNAIDGLHH